MLVSAESKKTFNYDYSYWSHNPDDANYASQDTVYSDIGTSVLKNVWQGYNSTLFAYGLSAVDSASLQILPLNFKSVCTSFFEHYCERFYIQAVSLCASCFARVHCCGMCARQAPENRIPWSAWTMDESIPASSRVFVWISSKRSNPTHPQTRRQAPLFSYATWNAV